MKSLSLKVQIAFLVIILVAALVGVFSWTVATGEKKMMMSQLHRRVILQARNIALSSAKPLLHHDPEFVLHPLITRVRKADRNIVSITVVDSRGVVRGSEDVMMIEREYREPSGLHRVREVPYLMDGEKLKENRDILFVSVPVLDQDERIGAVSMGYSKQELKKTISGINSRMIKIGLIALAAGSLLSLMLGYHITRPVKKLEKGARAIGRGELRTRIKIKSVQELKVLADSFNEMAHGLEKNRQALAENERMEKELELAHEIQSTLLPSRIPQLENFEIGTYYRPAAQVGGDYFDLVPLDDHRMMLIVGDVSGKGVPGLVVMAMVRILMRGLATRGEGPGRMLRRLNVLLNKDIKNNMFVTLFCGLMDIRKMDIVFASAAHMPLVFYRSSERSVHQIKSNAKPLGLFPDHIFSAGLDEQRLKLEQGDMIFQFTDGLNEMRNEQGEEFGIERILSAVARDGKRGASQLISRIQERYRAFRGAEGQGDDLTMLAISVLPRRIEGVTVSGGIEGKIAVNDREVNQRTDR